MDECKPLDRGGDQRAGREEARGAAGDVDQGRAVQVDPVNPKLKAPGTKRLKLNYGGPLSISGFKINLSRYTKVNADFGSIFSTLLTGTSAKLEPPEVGGCSLYTQGRSFHLPIHTLRLSCYELGPLFTHANAGTTVARTGFNVSTHFRISPPNRLHSDTVTWPDCAAIGHPTRL